MPVIAVKKAPCLMTVYRVIRGIHIKNNLPRRRLIRLHKHLDSIATKSATTCLYRCFKPASPAGVNSNRFNVLLPANGLPRSDGLTRPAPVRSAPAEQANTLSRHNSSWSFKSS